MGDSVFICLAVASMAGDLSGTVVDRRGEPVDDAVVCVLDAETGVPVHRETWAPFTDGGADIETAMKDIAFALADDDGEFRLADVPEGEYRLVAQSWPGAPAPSNLLDVNGASIHLRGVASVSVAAGETATARIHPLGDCALVLGDHAANDETLLVLSTASLRGDVALGFMAWPGPFLRSMIGFNRMPNGVTTVRGLPEGEIHVGLFSADNNGGFGAASLTLKEDAPAYLKIPFIAPWSDGIHQPPPDLKDLVDQAAQWSPERRAAFARNAMTIIAGLDDADGGMSARSVARGMSEAANRTVEVWDGEHAPLLDVAAALHYVSLKKRVESQGRTPNPWRPVEIRPATPREVLRAPRE